MKEIHTNYLARFGFSFQRGGTHMARTIMLEELRTLLSSVDSPEATRAAYHRAIVDENCLRKRSRMTRTLTYKYLSALYSLDRCTALFRALLYFWRRDTQGQPLLALLCSYARDPILRLSARLVLECPEGATVAPESLEEYIDETGPGRFSKVNLSAIARRVNSTLTQSGHLSGRVRKTRSRATATPGSVAYALLLGYLTGARGEALFSTEYAKLLDCPFERSIELAEDASRRGWIVFKRVGAVIEVLFPGLINAQEMEWIREQG